MLSIKKHGHVDDISFIELFGRISVAFFKIRSDLSLPNTRSLYLRWPFFFMKHSWTNSLNLSFSLKKSNVVMLLQVERDLCCLYSILTDI